MVSRKQKAYSTLYYSTAGQYTLPQQGGEAVQPPPDPMVLISMNSLHWQPLQVLTSLILLLSIIQEPCICRSPATLMYCHSCMRHAYLLQVLSLLNPSSVAAWLGLIVYSSACLKLEETYNSQVFTYAHVVSGATTLSWVKYFCTGYPVQPVQPVQPL